MSENRFRRMPLFYLCLIYAYKYAWNDAIEHTYKWKLHFRFLFHDPLFSGAEDTGLSCLPSQYPPRTRLTWEGGARHGAFAEVTSALILLPTTYLIRSRCVFSYPFLNLWRSTCCSFISLSLLSPKSITSEVNIPRKPDYLPYPPEFDWKGTIKPQHPIAFQLRAGKSDRFTVLESLKRMKIFRKWKLASNFMCKMLSRQLKYAYR